MKQISHSVEETYTIAQKVALEYKEKGGVIALYGNLGSGKTAFTSGFAKALGITEKVISPTFILIRHYFIPDTDRILYHVDLYRLENPKHIQELGLEEIFSNPSNIVLIEWPERLIDLPKGTKKIYFKYINENEREIEIDEL